MCYNKHLTLEEQEMILRFCASDCLITEIKKRLDMNKSTVSRELRLTCISDECIPVRAEELYKNNVKSTGDIKSLRIQRYINMSKINF
jgi:IS30 family transposase